MIWSDLTSDSKSCNGNDYRATHMNIGQYKKYAVDLVTAVVPSIREGL